MLASPLHDYPRAEYRLPRSQCYAAAANSRPTTASAHRPSTAGSVSRRAPPQSPSSNAHAVAAARYVAGSSATQDLTYQDALARYKAPAVHPPRPSSAASTTRSAASRPASATGARQQASSRPGTASSVSRRVAPRSVPATYRRAVPAAAPDNTAEHKGWMRAKQSDEEHASSPAAARRARPLNERLQLYERMAKRDEEHARAVLEPPTGVRPKSRGTQRVQQR